MTPAEFDNLSDVEKLAQAVEEFQNEGEDEWGLHTDDISHFIYWLSNQKRYQDVYAHFLLLENRPQ